MAIAPLMDPETVEGAAWAADFYGAAWPRPALQLVTDPAELQPAPDVDHDRAPVEVAELRAQGAVVRTGVDVTRRRAQRRALRRRRRTVLLATVVAGLVTGLALPVAVLGGSPAHPSGRAALVERSVYVVRPGDTLWSIAARVDRGGDPRAMAEALAREIGSGVVVPGERIAIP
jgi:hypothetical protein